jgi:signal transduction histidine kinase
MGDIITRLDGLNGIVQDLLLYSRPRQVKRESVDLRSLIENTTALLKRDPSLQGTTFNINGQVALGSADPEQIRIALQNVLMNAAQAMNGQGVVDVALTATAAGHEIAIRDHGPGFAPDARQKAFDPFFTTKHRGTGLGLPIARRIVEAHDGRIELAAPEGGGTVVTIRLPASPAR